ncbi:MAG: alcohol dehydrogenase catalytic domain-containing protein [Candidatus Eremiobacteraeota bacterium]|nr:alcohol dehydrogenase catalytic domain-containing protein [Candidatus Eremiobacteraeota bacterium]
MRKYRAASLLEPGKIEIIEKEISPLEPGDVLIRIKACGICTLEKRLYTGAMKIFYPIVGGHEASGVVEESRSNALKPGDRVVLDLLNRCGECRFCRSGQSNHCINQFKGKAGVLGGFSEYIVLPSKEVYKIDEKVPFNEATLTEPLSDCIHSCMQAGLSPENTVFVMGAGTMGLLHLLILKKYGIRSIISDLDEKKLETAKDCGADFIINAGNEDVSKKIKEITGGMGCNVIFVTTPGKAPLKQAFDLVSIKGCICIYAANYPAIELCIDPNIIHYKEIKITGTESKTEKDFFKAVGFQNSRSMNFSPLISATFKLNEINDAIKASLDPSTYRVIIEME